MKNRLIILLGVALLSLAILAGCGGSTATTATTAESGEGTTTTAATGETTTTAAGDETTTTEMTAPKLDLSDTIVLPEGWEINDAIAPADVEAILGKTGYKPWHETLSDAAAGKPQGSFFDGSLALSKVNFLVYTKDGKANYDRVAAYVKNPEEVAADLWEKLIVGDMENGVDMMVGVLILRGDQCLRIQWSPEHYKDYDKLELSVPWRRGRVNSGTGSIAARRTARAVVLPLRP